MSPCQPAGHHGLAGAMNVAPKGCTMKSGSTISPDISIRLHSSRKTDGLPAIS